MGRKNVVLSYPMVDATSMAASFNSPAPYTNTINLDSGSIYVSWTGTSPIGEISVQARNGDNEPWYTLDFNTTMPVTGNSGDMQIVFSEMPFTSIRLVYTRTSGTGTMDAVISAKTEGA